MRLPSARRVAVRLGSVVVALVVAGVLAVTSGSGTPAAAAELPAWIPAWKLVTLPSELVPHLLGSPSTSPTAPPSPTPPGEEASPSPETPETTTPRPERPESPRDPIPKGVDLSVTVGGPRVDVGPGGKSIRVDVHNKGQQHAQDVTVTIDATTLAEPVTVTLPSEGCTTDPTSRGRKVTCRYPDGGLAPGATDSSMTFFLMPQHESAERGEVRPASGGTVTVSVASAATDANPDDNTTTAQVRLVPSGVDLVAQVSEVRDVPPGQTAALAFIIANQGTETAHGISLELTLPPYTSFVDDYQTCTYTADRRRMVCDLATVSLAPDQALTAGDFDPIRIRVEPDAPGPATLGHGNLTVTTIGQVDPLRDRGAGPVLRYGNTPPKPMAAVWPRGAGSGAATASFPVSVTTNPADLSVTLGQVSGVEGDVVRLPITVTNHGPADAVGGFTAVIDAPTGTEIVGVPPECKPIVTGRQYSCVVPHQIEVGAAQVGQINLRIATKTVGDDGAVTVSRPVGSPAQDANPDNNRAAITVRVGTGGGGGGLPVTGTQVSMLVSGGAALLGVGVVLYLAGRRRRSDEVPLPATVGQLAENPPSTQIT